MSGVIKGNSPLVVYHVLSFTSLSLVEKKMPFIHLGGCIFHEIFLDSGFIFMLSTVYKAVLNGRCPLWYLVCGHAKSTPKRLRLVATAEREIDSKGTCSLSITFSFKKQMG